MVQDGFGFSQRLKQEHDEYLDTFKVKYSSVAREPKTQNTSQNIFLECNHAQKQKGLNDGGL